MTEVHALPLHELRKRKSVKWRQFPSDVLPLPVAEMDFPIAEPIKSALHDMVDRSDTGYLGPFREYRDGVKVHILCHPHNPVGAIFTSDSLSQLASLAKRYGVHIISDEIHGPLVFERRDFTPFLAVSDDAKDVGVTVTSASKGFNLAGLKCAVIVTSSAAIREKINSMPISVAFRASLFGAVAATAAFRDSDSWLDGVVSTLNQNRELIRNLIDTKIPAIKYRAPDFGYLAWLDLSALQLGDDPAKTILERGKLALNGGHMYGPRNAQYVRMNFGTSPEIITEAFDRIMKSL